MKKPLDRITEAYFGELGESFADKVRNRIHWVCGNAFGESILDVGCSQGITSILLGREGKNVIGIDLLEESIEYANNLLSSEEEITKKFVQFKTANFIEFAKEGQTFDCIIFGEILEHITDPKRFINTAANMLNQNGSIIITLPFGINDYFDHKKTYYLNEILNFQTEDLVIEEIKFFGKWIGAIVKRKDQHQNALGIDEGLLSRLENAFFSVERDLINSLRDREEKVKTLQEKVQKAVLEKEKYIANSATELKKKSQEITNINEELSKKNEELLNKDQELQKKLEDLRRVEQHEVFNNKELLEELDKKNHELEFIADEKNNYYVELNQKNQEFLLLSNQFKEIDKKFKTANIQIESKENELKKLKEQLVLKDKELKEAKDKEKKLIKYTSDLEKQVTISKKEKIKVQEDLFESYEKEEKLLKTHSRLMKRYQALSDSKLGSLTLYYWRKRRNVFGGK